MKNLAIVATLLLSFTSAAEQTFIHRNCNIRVDNADEYRKETILTLFGLLRSKGYFIIEKSDHQTMLSFSEASNGLLKLKAYYSCKNLSCYENCVIGALWEGLDPKDLPTCKIDDNQRGQPELTSIDADKPQDQ